MTNKPIRLRTPGGSKPISFVIVGVLGIVAFSALWMSYDLVRMLISKPQEPSQLAVFVGMVGGILAICTGALGFIGGMNFSPEKQIPTTDTGGGTNVGSAGTVVLPSTQPAAQPAITDPE